jgi:endonuclease/exonuclease/phosphatase family metal-dependent hydrolase
LTDPLNVREYIPTVWQTKGEEVLELTPTLNEAKGTLTVFLRDFEPVNKHEDAGNSQHYMVVLAVSVRDVKAYHDACVASGGAFRSLGYCACPRGALWNAWEERCIPSGFAAAAAPERWNFLTANVGNSSPDCGARFHPEYNFKLCSLQVEQRARERLLQIDPDMVALQETFPDDRCTDGMRRDPYRVCYDGGTGVPPGQQCERLLPPTIYDVRWTQLDHGKYECTGIKKSKATVTLSYDVDSTFICTTNDTGALRTEVTWSGGGDAEVINGHLVGPTSGNDECRRQQVSNMFENAAGAGPPNSIIAGDMNTDPYRPAGLGCSWEQSGQEWTNRMGTHGYDYHSTDEFTGIACSTGAPDYTLDHVVSNAYEGSCVVLDGAPPRLDGGEGMDHYALQCTLHEPPPWAKRWSQHAWSFDVTRAVNGNGLVAVGYTNDFTMGIPPDMAVVSFSRSGGIVWQKTYGDPVSGKIHDIGTTIARDGNGYVVAGASTNPGPASDSDLWVLRLTAAGTREKSYFYAASGRKFIPGICPSAGFPGCQPAPGGSSGSRGVDGAQEVIAVEGTYVVTGTVLENTYDGYVMRINPGDGTPQWTKKIGSDTTEEILQAIAEFPDGYVVGGYRIIWNGSVYLSAPWLVKVSKTDGARMWELTFAPQGIQSGGVKDLVKVEGDHILAVGLEAQSGSVWTAKVHSSGTVAWAKTFGVAGDWLEGRAGAYRSDTGRYVIAGLYSDNGDSGAPLILEMRRDGVLESAVRILKDGWQEVESVAVLTGGRIAIVGYGDEAQTPGLLSWNVWVCATDGAGMGCDAQAVALQTVTFPSPVASATPMADLFVSAHEVTGDQVVNTPATDLCVSQGSGGGDGFLGIGNPVKG